MENLNRAKEFLASHVRPNTSRGERLLAGLVGGALGLYALRKLWRGESRLAAIGALASGGALVARSATGYCPVYDALGVNTLGVDRSTRPPEGDAVAVPADHGVKVERSIIIERSVRDLYGFWRQLDNLPRIMRHLISVQDLGNGKSHWVAKAPFGQKVEWDAEIISEVPGEMLAWKSLAGSQVDSAGSVRFEKVQGQGTEIKVNLKYDPPGGRAGAFVAKIFRMDAASEIEADLTRFKQIMETRRSLDEISGEADLAAH